MKIAYFDCFAGAAGDMLVAAMLDAGLDFNFLKAQIAALGIEHLDVTLSETKRCGLRALTFTPIAPHQHHHRHLHDIVTLINQSKISTKAKQTAVAIFDKLAKAEAAVHGKAPNDIHFHEVGAVDSIVDIVSASVGLEAMNVQKVYCSTLSVGGGTVKCTHGTLPVPAPATAELIKGLPTVGGPVQFELLTPTGAAILATVVDEFVPLPPMKIEAVGCGAGSREIEEFPNIVRLFIGQNVDVGSAGSPQGGAETTDSVCVLETNIDDIKGELIGSMFDKLFGCGALDVFTTPIYMKHNRPGVQLSVICRPDNTQQAEQVLFQQGLTFGIRKQIIQRSKLAREFVTVKTEYGDIRVKVGKLGERVVNAKAEFSDSAAAAERAGVSVQTVQDAALTAYRKGQVS
jgi:hypothetical protein